MQNNLLWLPSPRLLWALFLSLLLHVVLLAGANWEMPDFLTEHDSIDVVLLKQAPPQPIKKPPPLPPSAKPKILRHIPPKAVAPLAPTSPAAPEPQSPLPPPTVPSQAAPPPTPTENKLEEEAVPTDTPAPDVVESLATRGYRHVEIEYRVFRGKGGVKGSSLGAARYEYQTGGEGNYRITAVAEASGLVSLFVRGKYVQQSEGMVGPRGLIPWKFSYQRGDNPDKKQTAGFDWQTHVLTMESAQQRETAPLTEGAQDQLSFMYQFMFVPPLEQMQLAITNGKRFRTYTYQFDGEETLQTDFGDVRAWHISKHDSEGDGKLELWLAPDYRYLPVKISQTEKDGTVTEQFVKQLKAE